MDEEARIAPREGAEQPERNAAPTTRTELTTADLAGVTRPAASPSSEARSTDDRPAPPASASSSSEEGASPLFSADEARDFRARWDGIQAGFVDEPRRAVEQADGLVAGAMARLAEIFAAERAGLEGQWDRGDDVTTEDLRLALRRYRSFFSRLLTV